MRARRVAVLADVHGHAVAPAALLTGHEVTAHAESLAISG